MDSTKRVVHGKVKGNGNYFSELPDFSLKYGKDEGLILFRVLPGKEYLSDGPEDYPDDYQCKKVMPDKEGYGQHIVIRDSGQFLPLYIYNFDNTM